MYTRSEVERTTLEYFRGDELATNIWIDKYCLKDKKGKYLELSPRDMHIRLANEFFRIESKYPNAISYEEIFELLDSGAINPGGSLLFGIGNVYSNSSLGNCFVIGNTADSYGGIFTTDQEQAQLMKMRAGVGHDISHLRPSEARVSNAAGTSTGAVSFVHRFSNTTREVAQNGRRGALMITLDIEHDDALQFIESKDDLTKVTGANISVKVDDGFMMSIFQDHIKNPRQEVFDNSENKKLWGKLVHQAWKSAEPGVLFRDKIKSESIPSCYGKEWEETSTNPCGR